MTVLNAFKREAPYLISILLRDGSKMCFFDEFNEHIHSSRLENKMIELKLHKIEELKIIIKRKLDFTNGVLQYLWDWLCMWMF